AIEELRAANCDIIVDDITFPLEPFFGSGRIQEEIESFTSEPGKLYFTSAGNFANNGYQAVFNSSTATPTSNFLEVGSRAHVFGTNPDGSPDVLQKINVEPGVYMIVLQWDESLASLLNASGAITDLDIFLVNDNGNLIVGNNRINEAGDPTEVIVFEAKASSTANILISSASGAPISGLPFRYIAFRADGLNILEYAGGPTVSGHAMTPAANTVAAVDYRNAASPVAQAFSSYGGNLVNSRNLEIDFAAPDGGNTNVASIGQDISSDEDTFTNFFGTSAAAPHAAGAFALLMSAIPNWYPDGLPGDVVVKTNASADEALKLVKETATAAGSADRAGAGLINLEAAFNSIAAQTPKITQLVVEDDKTPGIEPFEVTILGEFLPTAPKVIFDGQELEIVSVSGSEIIAIVGTFTGNPELIVETEAKSPTGKDIGISNGLTFLEDGKFAVNIIAENVSIEYGQAVDFSFKIEGLPNEVTYESTGLPEVKYATPAVFPYPDVNNYVLSPFFEVELTPEQKETYQINFVDGIFDVTKKELTIKAENANITYGDLIDVPFLYGFDETGIADVEDFRSSIKMAHESDFFEGPNNTLIVIGDLNPEATRYLEILSFIENGGWISTKSGIENGRRQLSIANNFIDLEVQQFTDFIDQSIINGRRQLSIANGRRQLSIANSEDLFNDLFDIAIENGRRQLSIANSSGIGDETDLKDYSKVFSIFDYQFALDDENPALPIEKFYSINLITGNSVTGATNHLIYPGAFLNSMAANFNVVYESGELSVSAKELTVETANLEINYGEDPLALISTSFEGFGYEETVEMVYPDGIPYYFLNEAGEEFEVADLQEKGSGTFEIRIRESKNYTLNYGGNHGKLVVAKNVLTVATNDLEIKFGELPFEQLETIFTGFAFDDTPEFVFSEGIPYYFIGENGVEYDKENFETMPGIGVYEIKVRETENYSTTYDVIHGNLTVVKATLAVSVNDPEIKYGENPLSEVLTQITGFAFADNQESVFPAGLLYSFVDADENIFSVEDKKAVGVYDIKIAGAENYILEYSNGGGILTILPTPLHVNTEDLVIDEGDEINQNMIVTTLNGFV
ncbi:MAG: S8 family serine peptidase, partial [Lutimonas sp.]